MQREIGAHDRPPKPGSVRDRGVNIGNLGNAFGNAQNFSSREASTKVAHDSLNWVRGAHNLNFGVEFTQADVWRQNQSLVPRIDFGINNSDPAFAEQQIGRLLQPTEVAGLAGYLCSEEAAGVTGQAIHIDGGSYQA